MRRRLLLAGLGGLALLTAVLAWVGVRPVLAAVRAIGAEGFAALTAWQVLVLALAGVAWFAAAPGAARTGAFVWARMVRETAGELLPFSQVGGLVLGARAAVRAGVPAELATASTLADVTAEVASQVLYTLIGITLLALRPRTGVPPRVLWPVLAGAALLLAAAVAALVAQRPIMRLLEQAEARWLPRNAGRAAAARRAIERIYARRARFAAATALHLAAWIGGAAGSWIALRFMGVEAPLRAVIALESLMFALRGAAFMLPGGLGVQEAAYALLGPLVGVPSGEALALSVLKRGRMLAIGAPVLAIWQLAEGRGLLRRPSS